MGTNSKRNKWFEEKPKRCFKAKFEKDNLIIQNIFKEISNLERAFKSDCLVTDTRTLIRLFDKYPSPNNSEDSFYLQDINFINEKKLNENNALHQTTMCSSTMKNVSNGFNNSTEHLVDNYIRQQSSNKAQSLRSKSRPNLRSHVLADIIPKKPVRKNSHNLILESINNAYPEIDESFTIGMKTPQKMRSFNGSNDGRNRSCGRLNNRNNNLKEIGVFAEEVKDLEKSMRAMCVKYKVTLKEVDATYEK